MGLGEGVSQWVDEFNDGATACELTTAFTRAALKQNATIEQRAHHHNGASHKPRLRESQLQSYRSFSLNKEGKFCAGLRQVRDSGALSHKLQGRLIVDRPIIPG